MTSKRRFQLLSGVEGVCAIKHTSHIRHFGHVPLVERLVEGFCAMKHTEHIRHIGHVPLVERLVEGVCLKKHTFHIRHTLDTFQLSSGWLKEVAPQNIRFHIFRTIVDNATILNCRFENIRTLAHNCKPIYRIPDHPVCVDHDLTGFKPVVMVNSTWSGTTHVTLDTCQM